MLRIISEHISRYDTSKLHVSYVQVYGDGISFSDIMFLYSVIVLPASVITLVIAFKLNKAFVILDPVSFLVSSIEDFAPQNYPNSNSNSKI